MLRDLTLKPVYRTESDNLLEDFYIPALKQAMRYDRAVGFFSASMLAYAAQGVSALAERGGRMRLIFGGAIEEDESSAIETGYAQRELQDRLGRRFLSIIENIADALVIRRLETLAWLVASGLLDIKVALKPRGMYHEKIGIFYDTADDRVVFQGSANETVYALLPDFNFESINVFRSWQPSHEEHALPYVDGFERLWRNESPGTLVIPFPEAARHRFLDIGREARPPRSDLEAEIARRIGERFRVAEPLRGMPSVPAVRDGEPFSLREHQRSALNAWKARSFQGILAMATGAGKTVTALYGISKLYEAFGELFVIVAVPYQSLADQWVGEFQDFGVAAIPCYASRKEWEEDLRRATSLYEARALKFAACVVVYRTLQSEEFQEAIRNVPPERLLIVGDECHNFGAEALCRALPVRTELRLGLSATPSHYFDPIRTARVLDYFGDVAYEYSLSQALHDKVLTPYRYYIHLVQLNEDETEEYIELTEQISRLAATRSADSLEDVDDGGLSIVLFKRSRLLGNAADKVISLRSLLMGRPPEPFTLFYCGDGESDVGSSDSTRQIDEVSKLLYELGWRVAHFTSRESRTERVRILDKFRVGALDALIAIRCLDEGIDVPACRNAYILSSSRNPKQFIQRRGRILRRSPGKSEAVIHDFVPLLPTSGAASAETERRLVRGELERIAEFAGLSQNIADALQTMRPFLETYDLHHALAPPAGKNDATLAVGTTKGG
jgi:superfamily II DNA or RNA helicase